MSINPVTKVCYYGSYFLSTWVSVPFPSKKDSADELGLANLPASTSRQGRMAQELGK